MSADYRCPICEHPRYGPFHVCPPLWRVRLGEDWGGNEEESIYADTEVEAAEGYARSYNRMGVLHFIDVLVCASDGMTWEPYTVEIELVPYYRASKDESHQPIPVEEDEEE